MTRYEVTSEIYDYKTKIEIEENKMINLWQGKKLVLHIEVKEDKKVAFRFFDTCEGSWDNGICQNNFDEIKKTILLYPFDFQVYSL